ncbi:MAG: hypothetical protein LBL94_04435 [Prevotellaceae bacterium]|jgi:hypothetical protein|nr:hypothetical protein [Prevotellaceae bacterium]
MASASGKKLSTDTAIDYLGYLKRGFSDISGRKFLRKISRKGSKQKILLHRQRPAFFVFAQPIDFAAGKSGGYSAGGGCMAKKLTSTSATLRWTECF